MKSTYNSMDELLSELNRDIFEVYEEELIKIIGNDYRASHERFQMQDVSGFKKNLLRREKTKNEALIEEFTKKLEIVNMFLKEHIGD